MGYVTVILDAHLLHCVFQANISSDVFKKVQSICAGKISVNSGRISVRASLHAKELESLLLLKKSKVVCGLISLSFN